jgi:4-hydroxythreonine-4-phosphate dehydrogenase
MTAPVALTMGDPSGVGGEIAVAAWRALRADGPAFFAVDDPARLRALGAPVTEIAAPADAMARFPEALPVLPERLAAPARPGAPDPENAAAVIRSIERAVALAQAGEAARSRPTRSTRRRSMTAPASPFRGTPSFWRISAAWSAP